MISKLATLLSVSVTLCSLARVAPARQQTITVGLFYGDSAPRAVTVSGQGDWEAHRRQGRFNGAYRVVSSDGELEMSRPGERAAKIGPWLNLTPGAKTPPLTLDGSAYRGTLKVEVQPSGGLKITNTLDLEHYLQGVVPNEMFAIPRALEALEVQAVVSRTLAIFIKTTQPRHPGQGFDVCAIGHCQFYRGVNSESDCANQAVQHTRGKVLTYQGKVILAAYHANAGGQTAPTDEAWPGSLRLKYLAPVASPYDDVADTFHYGDCYQWTELVRPEQIRKQVQSLTGRDVGEVRDVIVWRSESGRIKELKVVGSQREVTVGGPRQTRLVLGLVQEATGKSYDHDTRLVNIDRTRDGFLVTGYGAGEGVGLSQHGAVGMAGANFTYPQILGHYYRGVDLTEDYGSGSSTRLRVPDLRLRERVKVTAKG
jgi:stage II sporulation protein D